jgi:hypothetical protein
VLHVAGAEFELEPADAKTLAEQGFVDVAAAGPPARRSPAPARLAGSGEDDLQ